MKTPCPRCGFLLGPHHRARHKTVCERIPLPAEVARQAKTMTVAELAKEWGVNESTTGHRLRWMGISAKRSRKNTSLTEEQRSQIMELYNDGVPILQMAEKLGTVEELVSPAVQLLLAAGRIEKRKRPHGVEQDVPRCSVCLIWLSGPNVPVGKESCCGFCTTGDPGREIMEAGGAKQLAEDVLVMGERDTRSKNGYRKQAREWLASDGIDCWLDVLGCDLEFIKEKMARVL